MLNAMVRENVIGAAREDIVARKDGMKVILLVMVAMGRLVVFRFMLVF